MIDKPRANKKTNINNYLIDLNDNDFKLDDIKDISDITFNEDLDLNFNDINIDFNNIDITLDNIEDTTLTF